MIRLFISYKHSDRIYVDQVKSVAMNSNHRLSFDDHSLAEAILNKHGHVNRRPASDPASRPVKEEIEKLLKRSNKLLVIIGDDTHSSEWVNWEIVTFMRHKGKENVLMMRHQHSHGGTPSRFSNHVIQPWDPGYLSDWLQS